MVYVNIQINIVLFEIYLTANGSNLRNDCIQMKYDEEKILIEMYYGEKWSDGVRYFSISLYYFVDDQ